MMRIWSQWLKRTSPATAAAPCHHGRLRLEALEDRLALSFLPAVNYSDGAGSSPSQPALGDLNGDGFNDVVVSNFNGHTVSVYLNNGLGDGSLGPRTDYPVGAGTYPDGVALGDFNGDGNLDIVTANNYGSGISVLLGNGDGTFQAAQGYSTGANYAYVVVGDFNGDGRPDIAVTNFTGNTVSVLLGNGDGTFQAPVSYNTGSGPLALAVGDVNGDGIPDLVVPNQASNNVSVLLGNGDGTFQPAQNYATASSPFTVAVGDLNHDGAPDVVVGTSANTVSVLFNQNDGTGAFNPAVNIPVPGDPAFVAIADINHDGNPDIVTGDSLSDQVSVLFGKGDGTFPVFRNYNLGAQPNGGIAAGDLTGDTYNDIVTANFNSTNISVLINDTAWRPPTAPQAASNPDFMPAPVAVQRYADTTLTQRPTAAGHGDTVFTDSRWVAAVNHHTLADHLGLDWTDSVSEPLIAVTSE
jgi:hypothetical protein